MKSRQRLGFGILFYSIKNARPDVGNVVRELLKCMDGVTLATFKKM
jgi:hypothetical protein